MPACHAPAFSFAPPVAVAPVLHEMSAPADRRMGTPLALRGRDPR
jgi:hypothetical protein